jgi:integrase
MARLTAKFIENIKPAAARREIPDSGCRGLYLIVQPSGRRAWAVRYRYEGKTRKLTLDNVGLADARRAATTALRELERGNDPAALKFDAEAQAKQAAADRAKDTVDSLAARFIERHAKRHTRPNSWRQTVHVFDDIVLPVWRGRSVHDIERRDVKELVEGVAVNRPIMANRAAAVLSKFFNWCAEHDIIKASPSAGVKLPSKERARERVLSDDEIKALWLACDDISGSAGACIKLLLLTGQRRSEIANLKWNEIDGNLLVLPAERMKGHQAHEVPLSTQAVSILASLPRTGGYIFGASPVNHFDRIKRELDARMQLSVPWVVHDIRRTVASGMARIGVLVPVIEKVLGHRGGTFRGIVGTYQRHSFLPEMTAALERWANHVEGVVSGKSADVVRLGQR